MLWIRAAAAPEARAEMVTRRWRCQPASSTMTHSRWGWDSSCVGTGDQVFGVHVFVVFLRDNELSRDTRSLRAAMGNKQATPSKTAAADVGDVADAVRKVKLADPPKADPESDAGSNPTATAASASASAVRREAAPDPSEREPTRAGNKKTYLFRNERSKRGETKKKRDGETAAGDLPGVTDDVPMVAGGPGENFDADDAATSDETSETWGDTVTWLEQEMSTMRIAVEYPELLRKSVAVLRKWRASFPKSVWTRVIKSGRVAKELNECAPVIDRVVKHVEAMGVPADATRRVNVIDLCSGFGYLGMFLSELLDPRKVKLIVLLDKQWPMHGADPAPHQINWDHVYGIRAASTTGERSDTYEWTPDWPVPLRTRKMDLKQAGQLRQMETHVFQKFPGPFLVLAVHLCGTLSVKAVEMFNAHDTASMLCLKPCCLPEWNHTYTHDAWVFPKTKRRDGDEARFGEHRVFSLQKSSEDASRDEETPRDAERSSHAIPTTEVCAPGKWKNNRWIGPPRAYLRKKFDVWTDHLCRAVDVAETEKSLEYIEIQENGGHQNAFVFAERRAFATTPKPARGRYGGGEDPHELVSDAESRRRRAADRKRDKANGERSKKLQEQERAANREP